MNQCEQPHSAALQKLCQPASLWQLPSNMSHGTQHLVASAQVLSNTFFCKKKVINANKCNRNCKTAPLQDHANLNFSYPLLPSTNMRTNQDSLQSTCLDGALLPAGNANTTRGA